MKKYIKPSMLIMALNCEDIITTSNVWEDSIVKENEDIWEDFYN